MNRKEQIKILDNKIESNINQYKINIIRQIKCRNISFFEW